MKKFIPVIIDTLFTLIVSFSVAFVVLSYYVKMPTSFIISIVLSLLAGTIAFFILKNKAFKNGLNLKDENLKRKILDELCLKTNSDAKTEIIKAFTLKGEIPDGEIITRFSFSTLSKSDVAEIYKNFPDKKITLLAKTFDEDAFSLAKKLNFTTYDGEATFSLFKSVNYYPVISVDLSDKTVRLRDFFKGFFQKSHSKNYALTGLSLLLLSFLTPYKIYYVLFGITFLIFATACRFLCK